MSLGGPLSEALNDAVISAAGKGIKFVRAAGNSGADANNESPASANGANVHMISAMSQGDNWAYFSNYGNPPVDYCATGWRRRSVQLQHAAQVWRHLMLPVFSCKEM
jgi:hypothetical protein